MRSFTKMLSDYLFLPRAGLVALVLVAVACTPRQTALVAPTVQGASIERIFVATELETDRLGLGFGEERPEGLNFLHVDVSVPPTHELGKIEWPKGPPDAATDFVVADMKAYGNGDQMLHRMRDGQGQTETVIYIHGYNSTFSESVYRFAQIRADFRADGPGLLYSWPSAGDPRGYAYDRDSVLYSRDDFARVLDLMTRDPNHRVVLLAHSMGAQLVMESLRQVALHGDRRILERINAVVLMSPDIDPDVFRSQAEAIGDLPQPFLIFVSRKDRALSLAGLLTGRKPRLGVTFDREAVKGLPVNVVDFTALSDNEGLNHSVPTTSPAAINVLRGMVTQAEAGERAFEEFMILTDQP